VCDDDGVSGANLRVGEGGTLPRTFLGALLSLNANPLPEVPLISRTIAKEALAPMRYDK
jgi:hypothetical protein